MFDYKCDKCGFTNEYNTSIHMPLEMRPPKDLNCPNVIEKKDKNGKIRKTKCKGTLEKLFTQSKSGVGIDVIGGYEYQYGKKAWKKNMSMSDRAAVLTGEKNPY